MIEGMNREQRVQHYLQQAKMHMAAAKSKNFGNKLQSEHRFAAKMAMRAAKAAESGSKMDEQIAAESSKKATETAEGMGSKVYTDSSGRKMYTRDYNAPGSKQFEPKKEKQPKSMETGARGGRFYITDTGKKVYVGQR